MPAVGPGRVTDSTCVFGRLVSGGIAQSFGLSTSADGGRDHGGSKRSVDEVGDAAARATVLVAGVGRGGGEGQGRGGEQGHGAGGHAHSQPHSTALA